MKDLITFTFLVIAIWALVSIIQHIKDWENER